MIRVDHLCKRFGNTVAVNDVSLTVAAGEMVVLVGPSGCGKTTLLRLIAGLERVDSGSIYFGDQLMNDIRPKTRNVSFVFQDFGLLPHLNIYENIAYGLKSRGVPRQQIRPRVEEAAKRFRVESHLKRKPAKLSGGERQRVALARALVRKSNATFYDEPLSSLDAQLRAQARIDIMALHRQKQTPSIYVTHDQAEGMTMGDRIAVMRSGKIEQIDTPQAIYDTPINRFVAEFMGSGINWFDIGQLPFEAPPLAMSAGIRPEHVRLVGREGVDSAETQPIHFTGTVKYSMGRHHAIAIDHREDLLVYSQEPIAQNETLNLMIDLTQVMWFDASGKRL